ncbi:hypothetical protein [Streptosporangium longisporum]|uniref:DUF2746 domain-containing protein n=1 Tax=Streptosporangium longisporum TaxID=46187 RepID=A0ABP6LGT5_9ACTN
MTWADAAVFIAQGIVGGGIVQAFIAITKRRSELRQLDRGTDSVMVETASGVVTMLRTELESAKSENATLEAKLADQQAKLADQQRQIHLLGERISELRTDLVIAKAEIHRLQDGQEQMP